MTTGELLFFDRLPRFLSVYEALKEALEARYPEVTVKVTKTQISFRRRYVFAMVSLPYRRKKEWPKEYLMVSFGLPAQKESPRIAASVEAYPGRWTHHEIDLSGTRKIVKEKRKNIVRHPIRKTRVTL